MVVISPVVTFTRNREGFVFAIAGNAMTTPDCMKSMLQSLNYCLLSVNKKKQQHFIQSMLTES